MATVVSNALLIEGLRTEFTDTYKVALTTKADPRLPMVMDLNINATNRQHTFAYLEAPPHPDLWRRGETVPTDAMDSTKFTGYVYEWARRVPWNKWDRKDDQTDSLFEMARMCGENMALVPERLFFQVLTNSTTDLQPAIENAPDGVAMFSTTDGDSAARFGVTNGNLLTGSGITTTQMIQADYYAAIEQMMLFQDGKGQPLHTPERINRGTLIIHAAADTEAFELAFRQLRQGIGLSTTGARSSTATITAATAESNVIRDSSRNVQLWGTPRLATGDWYVFMQDPPKLPTYLLDRQEVREFGALEDDDNSDHVRDTANEYIQFEARSGAGPALPYACVKINN